MRIDRAEWDDENEKHSRHGVTPDVLQSVRAVGDWLAFPNTSYGHDRFKVIGHDENGRMWTIIVQDKGDGVVRPITGWPATNTEIKAWEAEQ